MKALHHKISFLQLLEETTSVADESSTRGEAEQIFLDKVCTHLGWPVGHVYLTGTQEKLIPSKIWHLENPQKFDAFRKITEDTSFDSGIGLPGRVMADEKPAWITDVTKDQNFPRAKSVKNIGVKAGIGLPVFKSKRVVEVIEIFSEKAVLPDNQLLKALSNLTNLFGWLIERKQTEEALKKTNQKLRDSLAKVKLLSGLIPICSQCKNIRDDEGYWKQIESYIKDHSEAEFSHGICPECAKKLYPDFYDETEDTEKKMN
jgi:signal transduction protein with GAF and PtsI domain|tara:strand:- start:1775 stop:2554 length:780 start_codon:yes stop_codon:yes gene_type:complete